MSILNLTPHATPEAKVIATASGWQLEIPAGVHGTYRLAQLDNYSRRPRRLFSHAPPLTLHLSARVSSSVLPGTWGFGLWNDPFGLSLGLGGAALHLPALPQATWFFYGSPENTLSFGNLPGNGFFAGTFSSPLFPSLFFTPAVLGLPLLVVRPLSRLMRSLAGKLIRQSGTPLHVEVTSWHDYKIDWQSRLCRFYIDDLLVLETPISPHLPLGLVIWVDNQYAAWKPDGRLGYGTLENPVAWLEIERLEVGG